MKTDPMILLPGLGADHRLFSEQTSAFPLAKVPAYIPPIRDEPLADYAVRWSKSWDPQPGTVLVGFAFGGMAALEAAAHSSELRSKLKALVLVSSCRSVDAFDKAFRRQVRLSKLLPDAIMRAALKTFAERFSPTEGLSDAHREHLSAMAADIDLPLFRWGAKAAAHWQFAGPEAAGLSQLIHEIHGARDEIIPGAGPTAQLVIPDGGHLIQFTHAQTVNAYLAGLCKTEPTLDSAGTAPGLAK